MLSLITTVIFAGRVLGVLCCFFFPHNQKKETIFKLAMKDDF